ncbi:MAG: mycofactocin biosynthesis chaperone MftB [Deltaproteobacteria bacterium]|nr:mycofactocin biosynthesis chaperone MftB [Deltaproteobacteria bacterium]
MCTDKRYMLAPGTQVREEDFGLLFYTMEGPRLFFLSSGRLLAGSFFLGERTLKEWIERLNNHYSISASRIQDLTKTLHQLKEKGVIIER